jgi:glycosyltransferase involved in cell wall biosynthesis
MKFSIITPSYNQGEFIERTIDSVLSQRDVTFDYLVVDGASTDNTAEILRRSTARDARMQWISEPDRGQAHAVNKGIKRTTGDIIGWLNSDDVYYPGALRAVANAFETHPGASVVYGNGDHIFTDDTSIEEYPVEDWSLETLMDTCFICQPAAFFRRAAIKKFGPLNERLQYCMDYELWLRFAQGGAIFLRTDKKLAGSRLYAQNKTLAFAQAVHREINDMTKEKFGRVPDRWLYKYAHVATRKRLDRSSWPRTFSLMVGTQSLAAALRWNRGISGDMRKKIPEVLLSILNFRKRVPLGPRRPIASDTDS